MPPILSLVIQPLVHHLHNLDKITPITSDRSLWIHNKYSLIISHLSDFVHLSTGRTPWIVRSSIPDFRLECQLS